MPESSAEVGRRGLELQRPWSELLLTGVKTVETRGYALPAALVGVPLLVIETEPVVPGQSGLGDVVQAGTEGARLTGEVTFSECIVYEDRQQWLADSARHCVATDSVHAWPEGQPAAKYGWVVSAAAAFSEPQPVPRMCRELRSIFSLADSSSGAARA